MFCKSRFRFLQVYIRLDQPMAALEVYRTGLDKFPNEVTFLTGVARIYEAIGNLSLSAKYYKILLVVRETISNFVATYWDIGMRREIIGELDLAFIRSSPPSKVIPPRRRPTPAIEPKVAGYYPTVVS